MKQLITILSALLLCTGLSAQNGFFCTKAGHENKWTVYDPDGNITGYCVESLKASEGTLKDGSISFSYDFLDESGKSVINGKTLNMMIKMTDGQVHVDLDNVTKAMKSDDYMCKGDMSSIPADIKVGDVIPDSSLPITVAGLVKTHNDIKDRKVTGKETITTPAGTFNCFVIEEKEYDQGGSKPLNVKSWIALDIGVIKQKVSNDKGAPVRSFELTKLVH
ncbi:MAG: hypothetical protein IKX60_05400 [Bacteroidales bacterium]|nr:hypothetical protein [Bacteroidales bacterium]